MAMYVDLDTGSIHDMTLFDIKKKQRRNDERRRKTDVRNGENHKIVVLDMFVVYVYKHVLQYYSQYFHGLMEFVEM